MSAHYSVLLQESIKALNLNPEGIYVDGTLGRGGHSCEIAKRLTSGKLICFDKDQEAIDQSTQRLQEMIDRCILVHDNFCEIETVIEELGLTGIDGMVLDLGVSSPQFDEGQRGFSYRFDSMLDMRMDQQQPYSAWNLVNEAEEKEISDILYRYGEEPFGRSIARQIIKQRALAPIDTTFQLVDVIRKSLPSKVLNKKGHPAKQTFQALRIAVNGELDSLEKGIEAALRCLNVGGRLAIITFHSLEDRIVKEYFRTASSVEKIDPRIPLRPDQIKQPAYRLITKKPILPTDEELEENNRSHSAKLRIIERTEKNNG